jgi:hypothetical protein
MVSLIFVPSTWWSNLLHIVDPRLRSTISVRHKERPLMSDAVVPDRTEPTAAPAHPPTGWFRRALDKRHLSIHSAAPE